MIIKRVTLGDFEGGRLLLRSELGSFFESLHEGICLEAYENEELVGAAFAPYSKERSREFIQRTCLTINPAEAISSAGLVVKESRRGEGIGRELFLRRDEEAAREGYRFALYQSWLQSPAPSEKLLRSAGAREVARLPGYWKKDYPIEDYCNLCGDFCFCTALLFYRRLR